MPLRLRTKGQDGCPLRKALLEIHKEIKELDNIPEEEYIEDFSFLPIPDFYPMNSTQDAKNLLESYMGNRLASIVENNHDHIVMMLSGGVDSMLAALILRDTYCLLHRKRITAITVSDTSHPAGRREADIATQFCAEKNIEHEPIEVIPGPTPEDIDDSRLVYPLEDTASMISSRLNSTDPWQVGAGTVFYLVTDFLAQHHGANKDGDVHRTAIVSASGADVLFGGGYDLSHSNDPYADWEIHRNSEMMRCFSNNREIPDFYDRVSSVPFPHYKVWQTHSAIDTALRIDPAVIRGGGEQWCSKGKDKEIFYSMLSEKVHSSFLKVEEEKIPMQKSSGIFDHLVQLRYTS